MIGVAPVGASPVGAFPGVGTEQSPGPNDLIFSDGRIRRSSSGAVPPLSARVLAQSDFSSTVANGILLVAGRLKRSATGATIVNGKRLRVS